VFLLARGDAMLALGDLAVARLFYARAASLGSARAATSLGRTYDPEFLASIHATGITPDRAAASDWYRKGAALGDRDGAARLARLTDPR
jgi:TPR repeat protein